MCFPENGETVEKINEIHRASKTRIAALIVLALAYAKFVMPAVLFFASRRVLRHLLKAHSRLGFTSVYIMYVYIYILMILYNIHITFVLLPLFVKVRIGASFRSSVPPGVLSWCWCCPCRGVSSCVALSLFACSFMDSLRICSRMLVKIDFYLCWSMHYVVHLCLSFEWHGFTTRTGSTPSVLKAVRSKDRDSICWREWWKPDIY